jgi:hypothetical protein
MLAAIKDRDKLLVAFCTQLRDQGAKGDLKPDANELIKAFNRLDHNSAVTCLLETVRAMAHQSYLEEAKAIGRFALAWLPATFTYDQHLDRIRAELEDMEKPAAVLPTQTQNTLSTEVLLSVVEQASVRLLVHKKYLLPEMDLGNLPERGMDEDNTQLKREMEAVLKARFCSDNDLIRLEKVLQKLVIEVAKSRQYDRHLQGYSGDTLNQLLSSILDSLHGIIGRRFFFSVPEDYDISQLASIRKAFAPLALLISRCADPIAEFGRYVELERIVKLGLGDESLYEEMRQ